MFSAYVRRLTFQHQLVYTIWTPKSHKEPGMTEKFPLKPLGIRISPLRRFVIIAYVFTWLVWLPGILATVGLIPEIPWPPLFAIGACGPLVAAVWCLWRTGGWSAVRDWLKRGFTRRFPWFVWLLILLIPFVVPLAALMLYQKVSGSTLDFMGMPGLKSLLPVALLMLTIGGGQEEYGWRGYMLPRLLDRYKPWQADLILIPVHILWHLPLFFIGFTMQSQYPFWLFSAFGIGFTPFINRMYRLSNGSILAAIILHGLVNTGLEIFPTVGPTVDQSNLPLLYVGILYALLAIAVILGFRRVNSKAVNPM
jgi:membrane protease YdiL (CAAX protease family)